MNFFKNFLASVLGTFVAIGLFFVVLLMIVSAAATLIVSPQTNKEVKVNSILDLNLNIPITDRNPSFDEFEVLLNLNDEVIGLPEVLNAINKAAKNPNIKGIRLRSDYITAGWSQTRSIRNALQDFKNQGKFVYSYADIFTQKGYYLASVADSIVLNPMGVFELKGLASEVLYFKDFQDEYGMKMEVVRLGKYKSAVEPYLDNKMSEENRFQIKALLMDLWNTISGEIALGRKMRPEDLDLIINTQKISTPEDALKELLIDQLGYESDLDSIIASRLNQEKEDKINYVSVSNVNQSNSDYNKQIKDRVAIVFANGPILYGEGTEDRIAQGVFVETLQKLAADSWVKAVVLRIDSPGGSALTSELLWQTINAVKKEKPVMVSMGNVAASGGYYIAAGANQIFADPLTITGSIGVFAALPNASSFVEKIGINAETVETHPNALGYSIFQHLSAGFESQTKKSIELTYATFKKRVSEGRNLSETEVEALAQGRVWSGKQALEIGLIDSLGGLQQTVEAAAKKAGIEEYNLVEYPKFEEDLTSLFPRFSISQELKNLLNFFSPNSTLPDFTQPNEPTLAAQMQLRLPYELKIH
jgi:protease-4